MLRGEVYKARLDPVEGSEQGRTRPVVIVSRDAINKASPVVVAVPVTDRRNKRRLYPSHVEIPARSGGSGLTCDSVVLCEQVRAVSITRMEERLGQLSDAYMARINAALKITLDLP